MGINEYMIKKIKDVLLPSLISETRKYDWQELGVQSSDLISSPTYTIWKAATELAMPRYGIDHRTLAESVAEEVGKKTVIYFWLSRCVALIAFKKFNNDNTAEQ